MIDKFDPILAAVADLKAHVTSEFSRRDEKFDQLKSEVAGVKSEVAALRERFDRQPDLHLLGRQMQAMIERLTALEGKNVRAIAAINDFARKKVTPGEVEALHSELKEIRELEFRHDVRLRRIEDELHLT